MQLERVGLTQCQGVCSALRLKSRISFGSVSVVVPQGAKHSCICRHRWNPNLAKGMAMSLGQFMIIPLAGNVPAPSRTDFLSDRGVTVTRGLKSITIPDGVNVAPAIGSVVRRRVMSCIVKCRGTVPRPLHHASNSLDDGASSPYGLYPSKFLFIGFFFAPRC